MENRQFLFKNNSIFRLIAIAGGISPNAEVEVGGRVPGQLRWPNPGFNFGVRD